MSNKTNVKNIALAIRMLPNPKTYNAIVATIAVSNEKYTFEKINNEWHYKI